MTDLSGLRPGLRGEASLLVGEEHTAPRVGSGAIHVLATPVMINVIEAAALAAVERLLPAGHQSLGPVLDVGHIAAPPVGMRVTAAPPGQKIDGPTIFFSVGARAERARVGAGTHASGVVYTAEFQPP